jgi:putative ABC transport system permease protein
VAFPLRSEGALQRQEVLLRTLWLAAGLVLLLGAANLTALLTARAVGQKHHWAVRLSVGATPAALVRLVIHEMLLIAAAGLVLGLLVRFWLLRSIAALEPTAGVPIAHLDLSLDWRVLLFAIVIVIVSAGVASAGAARQAARADLSALLAAGASTGTRTTALSRQVLLAAHVALAMTLLTTAAGLIATVRNAMRVDLGFARDEVIFVRVRPALSQYMSERDDVARRTRDYGSAAARLRALPAVTGVSYGSHLLDAHAVTGEATSVTVDGVRREIVLRRLEGGAGYLGAVGAAFVAGRDLDDADARAAVTRNEMLQFLLMRRVGRSPGPPPKSGRSAAVIDAALAQALWPDAPAVGRTFRWDALQITYEVVGVVRPLGADMRGGAALPTLVAPVALETIDGMQPYSLMVRTHGRPDAVVPHVIATLRGVFPDAPLLEVQPARQVAQTRMAQQRMGARVFTWYAVTAVVLGLAGIHGLLAFFVAQTRRELAIRAALGAGRLTLVRISAARILAPVMLGLIGGLLLSGWLRQVLGATVIGLREAGAPVQAASAALFLLASIAVIAAGTRRVSRISPAEVLYQP